MAVVLGVGALVTNLGGADDPVTITTTDPQLTYVPADAALSARTDHVTISSGDAVLVWGGRAFTGDETRPELFDNGALYDVESGEWTPVGAAPLSPRYHATGVWTGSEMIVVGGWDLDDDGFIRGLDDGAAYNPATDTWRQIASAPVCPTTSTWAPSSDWSSARLVAGGRCSDSADASGAVGVYNLETDTWIAQETPLMDISHVFTVGSIVVGFDQMRSRWATLDPQTFDSTVGGWSPLPAPPFVEDSIGGTFVSVPSGEESFAVVSRLEDASGGGTVVHEFDFVTWTWDEGGAIPVAPPISSIAVAPAQAAPTGPVLAWPTVDGTIGWYDPATVTFGTIDDDAVTPRLFQAIVTVGGDSLFAWGGHWSTSEQDATVFADGVIADVG
jgi:hypothetical protein